MTDLKPCPFCGSDAVLNDYSGREYSCYYVQCPKCHIGTEVKYSETAVVKIWNRRVKE